MINRSPTASRALRSLKHSPVTVAAVVFLAVLIFCAIFAPVVAPTSPYQQNLSSALSPPFWWPGGHHGVGLLGTDALGRDNLSRVIYGSRVSLLVGFGGVLVSGVVGVLLGAVAAYRGGVFDHAVMRTADAFLAIPLILLAIEVVAVFGSKAWTIILALALASWMTYARLVRGEVLVAKAQPYAEAARCLGLRGKAILFRHILPNSINPVIVIASFSMADLILAEAALSFLGVGIQPPTPTWGGMLANSQNYLYLAPWTMIFPGAAISLTVLAVNLVGDWMRDFLDPRLQLVR